VKGIVFRIEQSDFDLGFILGYAVEKTNRQTPNKPHSVTKIKMTKTFTVNFNEQVSQ